MPKEYCCKHCRDEDLKRKEVPSPILDAIVFADPRDYKRDLPVVAFYFPDREEPCDKLCRSSFLGNFYDLGPDALLLKPPNAHLAKSFRNAEAAFQALKFWRFHGDDFAHISGSDAFKKKRELNYCADMSYCGFGSNWKAMLEVLRAKFKPGAPWTEALLKTSNAFLLEHNSVCGRDAIWSDDKFGEGKNWLGLQLMLVRDENAKSDLWTSYIARFININSGEAWSPGIGSQWQRIVRYANHAALAKVAEEEELPPFKRNWPVEATHGANVGDRQTTGSGSTEPAEADPQNSSANLTSFDQERKDTLQGIPRWEEERCAQDPVRNAEELSSGQRLQSTDLAPRFTRSKDANKAVALWRGDIAQADAEVIVSPAGDNSVSRAISRAAGAELHQEYLRIKGPWAGHPALTKGYQLKAKHVLHAVAPFSSSEYLLEKCYRTALDRVAAEGLRSVAFPCISTDSSGYGPFKLGAATRIALRTVRLWLDAHVGALDCVIFVTFGYAEHEIYARLLPRYFPRRGDLELAQLDHPHFDVRVTFTWNQDCRNVELAGCFNDWGKPGRELYMQKNCEGVFEQVMRMNTGRRYEYKFIVDGEWRYRNDQPTVKDSNNQVNNVLDLSVPSTM